MKWQLWKHKNKKTPPPAPQNDWRREHAHAKLDVLKQGIEDALSFLRHTHIRSIFYRRKLPWYMILGSERVGKTGLLAMSGLSLLSLENQPLDQKILPTAYCDWWFGKEAVFLDAGGTLLMAEDPKSDSHFVWSKFIAMLYRYRRHQPVDGLILCVDLQEFLAKNRGQKQLQVDIFRHRVQSILKYVTTLPVYLVFTKCDRIAGFVESFSTMSPEDVNQIFGITLPFGIPQQSIAQRLEGLFDDFLKRLNEQLIVRLHREHNVEKRAHIKNFPLQLESQKRDILNLAAQMHTSRAGLGGIYFTSSIQDGKVVDALNALQHTFNLPAPPDMEHPPNFKGYFIQPVLQKIAENKWVAKGKLLVGVENNKKYLYGISAFMVLVSLLLVVPSYFYNKALINDVSNVIAKYPPSLWKQGEVDDFLPLLGALNHAYVEVQSHSNAFLTFVFHQGKALRLEVESAYSQALAAQFYPEIKKILEKNLQAGADAKPQELFDTLKVYLMLGNPEYLNRDFVSAWFKQYWERALANDPGQQAQLMTHLKFWLNNTSAFVTDEKAIAHARQLLSGLQLAELTYLTLQEKYEQINPEHNALLQDYPEIARTADLYKAVNFSAIYEHEIPELAQQMVTGENWVLNLELPKNLTQSFVDQLSDSVRRLYITRYAAFWQLQLMDIKVPAFKNLAEAELYVASLNSTHSPLKAFFKAAETNLKPIEAYPEANQAIAAQHAASAMLTAEQDKSVQKALNNLTLYLNTILQSKDSGEAALNAAIIRMHKGGADDPIGQLILAAKMVPPPLSTLLNSVALNSWQVVLNTAQNHMNYVWMSTVVPEYNAHIKNRYPVFKDEKEEMSLKDFAHFFGVNGAMDKFFRHYLSAFVDSSQLYWKWREVDGARLHIPQATLEMFDRAAIIRKMYGLDLRKTPNIQFTLMPFSPELMSRNYILSFGEQTIDYPRDFRQAKLIAWPTDKTDFAALEFSNGTEREAIWRESGPWALFKLLAQAEIVTTRNPREYTVRFIVHGEAVTYELMAGAPINPFIPDILQGFRCPGKL